MSPGDPDLIFVALVVAAAFFSFAASAVLREEDEGMRIVSVSVSLAVLLVIFFA